MLQHRLRLIEIAWVCARYDVRALLKARGLPSWPLAWAVFVPSKAPHAAPGEKLALALQNLGPAFIKFGQTLATRFDLLGRDFARDLMTLQDNLPPFPAQEAKQIIASELERPLSSLFSSFEETPVGAASIAQVHRALTTEGTPVAVKVVRPDIEAQFQRDLNFMRWLAGWLSRHVPSSRRLRLDEVVETLAQSARLEIDLRLEAAAAAELAELVTEDEGLNVPAIDWQRTSQHVMTLQWVEGIPLSRATEADLNLHDRRLMATRLIRGFFRHVFHYGYFHADLHPGNLFLTPEGSLTFVDFGIMGRLDKESRLYLAGQISAFLDRDYHRMAELHFDAGYVPASQNVAAFAQACRSIGEPVLGRPLQEISIGRLLAQLFMITETFQMQTQPQLILFQKSLVLIESLSRRLDPTLDMWKAAEEPIRSWAEQQMGLRGQVTQRLRVWNQTLQRIPALLERTDRVLAQMEERHQQRRPPYGLIAFTTALATTALCFMLFH